VTLATASAAIYIAVSKAPPESNEQLAVRVSKLNIEVEDLYDAVERWGKRNSVRDSRARHQPPPPDDAAMPPAKTGIMRQPLPPGARVIGGRNAQPTGA